MAKVRVSPSVHAQRFDVAPQHAHAKAVKRREQRLRERAMPENLVDALGHLVRGLIGEGHRQDRIRRHAALFNQIRDAVRDHARLARPRTGQQQHRAIDGPDAFALLRIHIF